MNARRLTDTGACPVVLFYRPPSWPIRWATSVTGFQVLFLVFMFWAALPFLAGVGVERGWTDARVWPSGDDGHEEGGMVTPANGRSRGYQLGWVCVTLTPRLGPFEVWTRNFCWYGLSYHLRPLRLICTFNTIRFKIRFRIGESH